MKPYILWFYLLDIRFGFLEKTKQNRAKPNQTRNQIILNLASVRLTTVLNPHLLRTGSTQVKCWLLISRIFHATNFRHILEMPEFNLWHFCKMLEIHYIKNVRIQKSTFDLRIYFSIYISIENSINNKYYITQVDLNLCRIWTSLDERLFFFLSVSILKKFLPDLPPLFFSFQNASTLNDIFHTTIYLEDKGYKSQKVSIICMVNGCVHI